EMEEGEDRQGAGVLSLVRPHEPLVAAIGGPAQLGLTNLLVPRPGDRMLHPEAYARGLLRSQQVETSLPALSTTVLRLAGRPPQGEDSRSSLNPYGAEGSLERLSAWEVLDPERWSRDPRRQALAGAVVLVGPVVDQSSAGYGTPFGPLSGLEILGTATA
ncbi:MAG: CHASE2 domain-containing protein, partial [Cyanobacteriota bacterium]